MRAMVFIRLVSFVKRYVLYLTTEFDKIRSFSSKLIDSYPAFKGLLFFQCTLPVRVMGLLGIKVLIVTNAAGGVNRSFKVGDIMVIKDHVGFPMVAGNHPLVGLNDER